MASEESRIMQEKYLQLKREYGKTSVILQEFGRDIKERYHIGHQLEGTVRSQSAQFHLAVHRSLNLKRAVKSYYLGDANLETNRVLFSSHPVQDFDMILGEIKALTELTHPNIIRLHEVFIDQKFLHLVLDLCKGGELFDLIVNDRLLTNDAMAIFIQILEGVKYMHEKGFAHRGLCLENVLFADSDKKKIKIIGLSGASRSISGFKMKYGSPMYMAPEVFAENYNEKCDVWSLGVIFYTMVVGHQPFQARSFPDLKKKVQSRDVIKSPNYKNLEKDTKKFIHLLLASKKRPSAGEIFEVPFVKRFLSQNNKIAVKRLIRTVKSIRIDTVYSIKVRFSNKLKIAIYKILSPFNVLHDLNALDGLWREFDVNGTEVLMEADLVNNIERILSKPDLSTKAHQMLKKFDLDKRGCITKDEFVGLLCDISDKAIIRQAFNLLDTNEDGFIGPEDFDAYFNVDDYENLRKMMTDTLDNDKMDFETFSVLVTKFVSS
jgi:calcium-dependent protein kinase